MPGHQAWQGHQWRVLPAGTVFPFLNEEKTTISKIAYQWHFDYMPICFFPSFETCHICTLYLREADTTPEKLNNVLSYELLWKLN